MNQKTNPMITKITISPEVREFNEAVESCDSLTDYQHDQEPADRLLELVNLDGRIPVHAEWLANAMTGIAIKRDVPPWVKTGQTPIQWAEGESIKR